MTNTLNTDRFAALKPERKLRLVEKAKAAGFESPVVELGRLNREIGLAVTFNGISHAFWLLRSDDEDGDDRDLIALLLAWYKEKGLEPKASSNEEAAR